MRDDEPITDHRLRMWVSAVRISHAEALAGRGGSNGRGGAHKGYRLTEERIRQLDGIGFTWYEPVVEFGDASQNAGY